jgi:arylsulfatase
VVRWPERIPAGVVQNGMMSHNDWFPTLLSAAGVDDIAAQLKVGAELCGTSYKVHLDGNNQLPWLTGDAAESARNFFFYVSDDGDLTAIRYDNWKIVFLEQRCEGTLRIWAEPFTELRVPLIFNLRTDPFEQAQLTSNTYYDWLLDHAFLAIPCQAFVFEMIQTLIEFPPRQKPASFSLSQVMAKLQSGMPSA